MVKKGGTVLSSPGAQGLHGFAATLWLLLGLFSLVVQENSGARSALPEMQFGSLPPGWRCEHLQPPGYTVPASPHCLPTPTRVSAPSCP